jgi:hypothetical protein
VCTSMNRLLRFLFAVPAWGTGMLAGGGLLPAILELHHERSLKRTNAANLPLTERVMALDVRGVLSFEGRYAPPPNFSNNSSFTTNPSTHSTKLTGSRAAARWRPPSTRARAAPTPTSRTPARRRATWPCRTCWTSSTTSSR